MCHVSPQSVRNGYVKILCIFLVIVNMCHLLKLALLGKSETFTFSPAMCTRLHQIPKGLWTWKIWDFSVIGISRAQGKVTKEEANWLKGCAVLIQKTISAFLPGYSEAMYLFPPYSTLGEHRIVWKLMKRMLVTSPTRIISSLLCKSISIKNWRNFVQHYRFNIALWD